MWVMKRPGRTLGRKTIGFLALLLLACNGAESEEPTAPAPAVEKTAAESPSQTPASGVPMIEEGAQKVPAYETVAGPARYPEDAPDCSGCTLTGTFTDKTGRTHRTWTSSKSGADIQKNMLEQLTAEKWQIQSNLSQSGQYALDATKDSARIAILIAQDGTNPGSLVSAIVTR